MTRLALAGKWVPRSVDAVAIMEDKASPPKPPAAFCRKSRLEAEALVVCPFIRFADKVIYFSIY
jgi:hypothetical protein